MKKIYLQFYTLLLLFVLVSINSCKKDNQLLQQEAPQSLIAESKSYFENNVLHSTDQALNSSTATKSKRQLVGKAPLWDEAFTKKTSLGEAVITPLRYQKRLAVKNKKEGSSLLNAQSYLMIYTDKNKQYHNEVVTWIPDADYLKHQNDRSTTFTGIVLIEDWQGNKIKSYLYKKENDAVKVYVSAPIIQKGDVQVNQSYILICEYTDWYQYVDDEGWVYLDTTSSCYMHIGGGGGNGFDTGPGDYELPYGSGGGPGSSGSGGVVKVEEPEPAPTPEQLFLSEIDDAQLSPCMKAILANIKNLSNGSVAGIIQKFTGETPGYNWTMVDGPLPSTVNGQTSTYYNM